MSLKHWIPTLTLRQWIALAGINILLSAITSIFVVQALTASPQRITSPTGAAGTATPRPSAPVATAAAPAQTQSNPAPAASKPAAGTPAATPAPASPNTNARVKIGSVSSAGQLQREQLVISNEGDHIDIKDWKISNTRGVSYKFKEIILVKDGFLNIYSQAGTDSPTDLYMGRTDPAWRSGDVITLESNDGRKIATYEVR